MQTCRFRRVHRMQPPLNPPPPPPAPPPHIRAQLLTQLGYANPKMGNTKKWETSKMSNPNIGKPRKWAGFPPWERILCVSASLPLLRLAPKLREARLGGDRATGEAVGCHSAQRPLVDSRALEQTLNISDTFPLTHFRLSGPKPVRAVCLPVPNFMNKVFNSGSELTPRRGE